MDELKQTIISMKMEEWRTLSNMSCDECGKVSLQVYGEDSIEKNVVLRDIGDTDMLTANETISQRDEKYVESMDELLSECNAYYECLY